MYGTLLGMAGWSDAKRRLAGKRRALAPTDDAVAPKAEKSVAWAAPEAAGRTPAARLVAPIASAAADADAAAAAAAATESAAEDAAIREVDEPAVCRCVGDGVFELPALFDDAVCKRVAADVGGRVARGLSTDRGAGLKTDDVYVRDLADHARVYTALDAGCHLIEMCTGRLVTYSREKAFVITYDAASTRANGRGLSKHKDRTKDRKLQANTLLVTLDGPGDYAGGGTKFYPPAPVLASRRPPIVARPGRGAGVTFGPDIEHEGLPLSYGKRRVIAIFTDVLPPDATEHAKDALRSSQRQAALVVFGRLKKA